MTAGFVGGMELGEVSLGALLGVRASIDGLAQQLARERAAEDSYQWGAVEVALRQSAESSASGSSLILSLGGPAYGRLWQVRRLVVGGAQWADTVAGSALVIVSPSVSTTPPLSDVVDEASALPLPALYSTGQVIVRHPNRLAIVIVSPTASTVYAVGGAATDMPDRRHLITTPD